MKIIFINQRRFYGERKVEGGSMKMKPIKEKDLHIGCINCSTARLKADLNMSIGVGFGYGYITFNGKEIYSGSEDEINNKKSKKLRYFEVLARKKKGDWRYIRNTPLHGETYQRQGINNWVCVESNEGFA